MKTTQIEQITQILLGRGESEKYIIDYLKCIVDGLCSISPKQSKGYLDVTIHNMCKPNTSKTNRK